jgi:GxxExxY protein
MTDFLYKDISDKLLKAFYNVYNTLGYGFLEKVYENSMFVELQKFGLKAEKQKHITVYYDEVQVGEYFADLIIEEIIIVELKAAESLCEEHEIQLINYLKATDIEVGFLINFGKKPEFRRKIFTNDRKSVQIR